MTLRHVRIHRMHCCCHWLIYVAVAAFWFAGSARASSTYSDPLVSDPSVQRDRYQSSLRDMFSVRALEQEETLLREALDSLPLLKPTPRAEQYGHHSGYHVPDASAGTMQSWIEFTELHVHKDEFLDGIAMVPAFNPRNVLQPGYGFPRRFKIEVAARAAPDSWLTVVDWTQADFPNPGTYPAFFSIAQPANRIRLTVTRGAEESGRQFFALGELMVFAGGVNIAPNLRPRLVVSDSFDSPPFWSPSFVADRHTHLGPTLMPSGSEDGDFICRYPQPLSTPPWIEIDLGQVLGVGRLELFAAQPAARVPIEGYGFPSKYRVELFNSTTEDRKPLFQRKYEPHGNPGFFWLPMFGIRARYIRLTALELPVYNGESVFALGETRVIATVGMERRSAAEGTAIAYSKNAIGGPDPLLLVDGHSDRRKIISEMEFIRGLAEAKERNRELTRLRARLIESRRAVRRNGRTALLGLISLLVLGMGGWVLYQRRVRRSGLRKLRQGIAADLHDEIGANLGTISMVTSHLAGRAAPEIGKKLTEVGHIAQESFTSVQELIWLIDERTETVAALLEKIEETARRILVNCEVSCQFPDVPRDIPVSLETKKSVLLLFKEAVYNCAKYAQADHVSLSAAVADARLEMSIEDDGCGFDLSEPTAATHLSGRGLKNMEQRAQLLGAEIQIHSELGKGTRIVLSLPLK